MPSETEDPSQVAGSSHGGGRVWTVADAQARLSEVLRLSETVGPQRIGTRRSFVVVPERLWNQHVGHQSSLGAWLVENTPRGTNLQIPANREDRTGRQV